MRDRSKGMTDYERGRLAGFAEGVEAAAAFVYGCEESNLSYIAAGVRALRAPSPKEDAPRCPGCGGDGTICHRPLCTGEKCKCSACRGTGRSTTGGGR